LLLHFAKERGDQPRLKLYNEGSLLLPEGDVCAPEHKAHQSTKEALNFRELRNDKLRRIPIPRRWMNSGRWLLAPPDRIMG
jgi:hypothetical protein